MNVEQRALRFQCRGDWLYGVATMPEQARARGVIIVVGGPQYRVGSHRQFALLARELAARGTPVLRFDYRGMGDSQGDPRSFEDIDDDLRAAVDHFTGAEYGVTEVVLWGLCDGASAALFYAPQDARVTGVVLANPWARSSDGIAKTTLKHYYRRRLLEPAFWKKIIEGRFNPGKALASFARLLGAATAAPVPTSECKAPLRERMREGLAQFRGKVLLLTSGVDLTAQEFLEMEKSSSDWKSLLARPQVSRQTLPDADHTFSRRSWRDQVAQHTANWLDAW
ncbi:hydrolase 1, exosortase A system-associated [Massilia sp. GCM10020059]|uniref:Hydrolase 1, exosortase A system-associated n=1 Tax=Massilia agrisoli TaxID=2892444 RepID=A0ABS8IQJ0_9BURK|nr:hydrolase 1, exosortase A system-associated [Massilia agrisoli]MCC6070650.1 hydrolase 1, exosortase A system-associated [Massilia agrisoli]